jgi:hypothetical protein
MSDRLADDTNLIEWSENWWVKTANPLFVWKALAVCLNAHPPLPIPSWCMPYLATTAHNLNSLAKGQDFREDQPPVSGDQAYALTTAALGLGSQGKKNAFAEVDETHRLQRHAMAAARGHDAIEAIKKERGITEERARRLLAKGKRLARLG